MYVDSRSSWYPWYKLCSIWARWSFMFIVSFIKKKNIFKEIYHGYVDSGSCHLVCLLLSDYSVGYTVRGPICSGPNFLLKLT